MMGDWNAGYWDWCKASSAAGNHVKEWMKSKGSSFVLAVPNDPTSSQMTKRKSDGTTTVVASSRT